MPYMMGGFPDRETSLAVADAYADAGADLVELGVPYADPLADGPVIHAAGTEALDAGATLDSVLADCERLAARLPVVPMAYANMALARGPRALRRASSPTPGRAGAIVPDLPVEEGGEVADALRGAGLALVPLVAPTTPPERRRRICAAGEGFVYLVSDTRTTGERDRLPRGLGRADRRDARPTRRSRSRSGSGSAPPEQAAEVGAIADGVIVGTRLVRAVAEADAAGGGGRGRGGVHRRRARRDVGAERVDLPPR